ncbi:unnamed protein product [Nesidiocoris tenuis]|uniref:Uncharacterized protein n=1 Tax=Nesidiocoris tenuis TaxID=355587 RepID=A0A6H5GMA0_9HEMI|nr:unnamed protein product [Nesidiocoris tenuis]
MRCWGELTRSYYPFPRGLGSRINTKKSERQLSCRMTMLGVVTAWMTTGKPYQRCCCYCYSGAGPMQSGKGIKYVK